MARVVLARRARRELLALDWPLIDAAEEALALLGGEPRADFQGSPRKVACPLSRSSVTLSSVRVVVCAARTVGVRAQTRDGVYLKTHQIQYASAAAATVAGTYCALANNPKATDRKARGR